MKIGLFGGAFDPVHIGHMAIARAASDYGLDKLIIIPTGNTAYKRPCIASGQERIAMLNLAFRGDGFVISDYEIKRSAVSYSSDTISHFKAEYSGDEIYFIIGDDSYGYIDKWHEPQKIFENSTVLVYPREGLEILPPAVRLDCPRIEVSSSEVREKILRGEDASDLLHKEVYNYIKQHGLYV